MHVLCGVLPLTVSLGSLCSVTESVETGELVLCLLHCEVVQERLRWDCEAEEMNHNVHYSLHSDSTLAVGCWPGHLLSSHPSVLPMRGARSTLPSWYFPLVLFLFLLPLFLEQLINRALISVHFYHR